MDAALVQFLISLAAILALAGIAALLKLGRIDPIRDEDHARVLADEVSSGFVPDRVSIDAKGRAAILCDQADQIMVLRRHGAHFSGRILGENAAAVIDQNGVLCVSTGESRFGEVSLNLNNPSDWVQPVNTIGGATHA